MLKIRPIETDKDLQDVINLLRETSPNIDARLCLETFMDDPCFSLEHTRIGEINDEIVSFVMSVPQQIRIGISVLKGGWIYFGSTKPEYRKRGFYTTIHRNMLQFLQQERYHLAMRYGSVRPYVNFGYTTSFYRSLISILTKKVKNIKGPYHVKRCQEKDINAIKELYDFYVQKRTSFNLVRPIQFWKTAMQCYPYKEGLLVVEDNKTSKIVGYLWIKPLPNNILLVEEVETKNKDASQTILAYCTKEAERLKSRKIYLPITFDHPFGQFCLSLGAKGSIKAAQPEGNRFGMEDMLNLLNPISALRTMGPEFERLILNSNYKDWTGKISFEINQEKTNLFIERGKVKFNQTNQNQNNIVKIPRTIVVQLITGFKEINEIKHHPRVSIEPQFLGILSTIFPKRYPQAPTWEQEFPGSKDDGILPAAKKYFTLTMRRLLKFPRKLF